MPDPETTQPATTPDQSEPAAQNISRDEEREIKTWDDERLLEFWRVHVYLKVAQEKEISPYVSPNGDRQFADKVNGIIRHHLAEVQENPELLDLLFHTQDSTGKTTTPPVAGVAQGADPVNLFNGSFVYAATDCAIDGAGIQFVFTRSYAQSAFYPGPLGFNWDHSANLWLRVTQNNRTIFASTGTLRADAYVRHEQHDYWVPPDGAAGILLEDGDSFILRQPDGRRIVYQPHPTLQPAIHVAARIEDRFGNRIDFQYADGRLARVTVNHPGRTVDFHYDTQERIATIRDFTGRVWRYAYDDLGDLAAVTLPATAQYPRGLTMCYEYSTALTADRTLQHNLTAIYDADGRLYLENAYGDSPGLLSYGRVVRQRQGNGEMHFDYANVIEGFDLPYADHERPTHETIVTERDGRQVRFLFNRFGNLLLREEYARLDGVPRLVATHFRYNQDGNLIATLTPLGVLTQALYGRDLYARRFPPADPDAAAHPERDADLTPEARLQFNQLLAVVTRGRYHSLPSLNLALGMWSGSIFPDVLDASTDDVIQKFSYEPEFSQPLIVSDPGFTRSADPGFIEDADYERHLTRFTYAPGRGFQHLLLAAIEAPNPTLPDGSSGGAVVTRYLEYDDHGRLVRSRVPNGSPGGLEIVNEYAPPGSVQEGFLLASTLDPGGLDVRSEVERDDLGRVVKAFRPPFFEHQDGRFVTRNTYNALGQLVGTLGTAPFELRVRYRYTRAGSLLQCEHDLRDTDHAPQGVLLTRNRYDEELHLLSQTIGGTVVGEPGAALKTARMLYDRAGRPFLSIAPSGRKTRTSFNERGLPAKAIEDYGGVHAVTRQFYDADGRVVRVIDARGGETRFTYDVFGRPVQIEDALGNRLLRRYDKLGNLLVECVFEKSGPDAFVLLSRRAFGYDELGRRILTGANRFETQEPADATQLASLLQAGPGPFLAVRSFYDNAGNLVRQTDEDGREVTAEYDALGRVVAQMDTLGNLRRFRYDTEGNLLRLDREEVTLDPVTRAVSARRHFAQLFQYDELNRPVQTSTSTGSLRYRYDSRGNSVAVIDALGNTSETRFDIFSRALESRRFFHRHQPGETPVPVITRFTYNEDDQAVSLMDALGRTTRFVFDSAGRLVSTILPDGSADASTYDRLGNRVAYRDRRGVVRLLEYDALHRNTGSQVVPGGTADIAGPSNYRCTYDALGRITQAENDFVITQLTHDSLDHLLEERSAFTPTSGLDPAPHVIRRQFSNSGALIAIVYPSGREIRYDRDALDRVTAVAQVSKGAAFPGAPALPEALTLASIEYEGLQRKRITRHSGLTTTFNHDFAGRTVEISHTTLANQPVLRQQMLYDALGNLRRRLELAANHQATDSFHYDSLLRLYESRHAGTATLLDLTDIAPPTSPLPEVLPDLQAHVDALLAAPGGSPGETLAYDLVGNRTGSSFPGGQSFATNDLDQYIQVDGGALQYDADGNRTEDAAFRYRYDLRSQPSLLERKADAHTTRFFYDYFGRRVGEQSGVRAQRFVFDGHTLIEQYDQAQLVRSVVTPARLDDLLLASSGGRDLTPLADLSGSVRALLDGSEPEAFYVYDPFGNLRSTPPPGDDNPFLFAGKRRLGESELYDFIYRTYDPAQGRFLQRDPKAYVDGTNLYNYALNNPLSFRDPLGLESRPEHTASTGIYAARAAASPMDTAGKPLKGTYNLWSSPPGLAQAKAEVQAGRGWIMEQTPQHVRSELRERAYLRANPGQPTMPRDVFEDIWVGTSKRVVHKALAAGMPVASWGLNTHPNPSSTVQSTVELPAVRLWGSVSGGGMKLSGLLNIWSASQVDNPYIKVLGVTGGAVEIIGGTVYLGGALTGGTSMMAWGGNLARYGGGAALTVVSGYTFIQDVRRGDVTGAVGSGANTASGITMLVTSHPVVRLGTLSFAIGYSIGRFIDRQTGWSKTLTNRALRNEQIYQDLGLGGTSSKVLGGFATIPVFSEVGEGIGRGAGWAVLKGQAMVEWGYNRATSDEYTFNPLESELWSDFLDLF